VVFIIPVLLGWLRLRGEQLGFYQTEMGVALFVLTISIILGSIILIYARLMNAASVKREQAEADLFRLASIVDLPMTGFSVEI
jgi:hypothetical protein